MHVERHADYAALSHRAAEIVAELVRQKPDAILGLPTGSTPEGFYAALVAMQISLASVRTFNLDEYVGLPPEHPQSYHAYMQKHLYQHVDVRPKNRHILNGTAPDVEAECLRYEEAIAAAGGLDLVILGVGHNGHIGFNEPGTPWSARTRKVALAERTLQANARFFGGTGPMPTHALTMGIGTILGAKQILLLASGEGKAEIVREMVEGKPRVEVPATALQAHPRVTVLLDKSAATLLSR